MKIRYFYFIQLFSVILIATVLLLALYFEKIEHYEPCSLCLLQRGCFVLLIVVLVAAIAHGPKRRAWWLYSLINLMLSLLGAGIALRQIVLQHLPADQAPACGPEIAYLFQKLPLTQALQALFQGSADCAVVTWRWLGLSFADWSFALFLLLAFLQIVLVGVLLKKNAKCLNSSMS